MKTRKTKIVATFGPAVDTPEMLSRLIKAGTNVIRLNFSHGTQKKHGETIRLIRKISKELNQPVAILQDLQGPKVRIGPLKAASYVLKRHAAFKLLKNPILGTETAASTDYPILYKKVRPEDQILINDGKIILKVLEIKQGEIHCRVVEGGTLEANKGVNVPGRALGFPALTEKDKKDLAFGLSQQVDYIALSMVRTADDVRAVKTLTKKTGPWTPVIAKLEQAMAIENLESIMAVADGVMVARGDLGVEIPLEEVPLLQKKIIKLANKARIPVITATQMLESMVAHARPTRAEVSDVANAIFDGTDALMLSGETASGKHPIRAVQMMSRIALSAEKELSDIHPSTEKGIPVPEAMSQAACTLASQTNAKAIVTSTLSGGSALRLSKYRPEIPIFAFTPSPEVARRMNLYWGVSPFLMPMLSQKEDLFVAMIKKVQAEKLVKKGDLFLMVSQSPRKQSKMDELPPTDLIKIHQM